MLAYITDPARKDFQPMNANFGLMPPLASPPPKKMKKELMGQRALADLDRWLADVGETSVASLGSRVSS